MDNAIIAMDPAKAFKEDKQAFFATLDENIILTNIVEKMSVEEEWLDNSYKAWAYLIKSN